MLKLSRKKRSITNLHPYSLKSLVNTFFLSAILGIICLSGVLSFYATSHILTDSQTERKILENSEWESTTKIILISRSRIVGLTLAILAWLCLAWFSFNRLVIVPLSQMVVTTEKIGHGQLNQTINVKAPFEIRKLSESINDLSVNIQEVLLFVWNQTETVLRYLENEQSQYKNEKGLSEVDVVKKDLLELQKMVSKFAFYDVHLDKKRVFDGFDKDTLSS